MAEYEDYMRERGAIPQHRAPIYAAQTKMTFPTGGDIPGSSETEDNTNAATDETTESIPQSVTVQPMGPLGKRKIDPYGQWQSVEPRKQE